MLIVYVGGHGEAVCRGRSAQFICGSSRRDVDRLTIFVVGFNNHLVFAAFTSSIQVIMRTEHGSKDVHC